MRASDKYLPSHRFNLLQKSAAFTQQPRDSPDRGGIHYTSGRASSGGLHLSVDECHSFAEQFLTCSNMCEEPAGVTCESVDQRQQGHIHFWKTQATEPRSSVIGQSGTSTACLGDLRRAALRGAKIVISIRSQRERVEPSPSAGQDEMITGSNTESPPTVYQPRQGGDSDGECAA